MKKTIALIMTLAMMLSCIAGFVVTSSAAEPAWVEKSYSYDKALLEYGLHDGVEVNPDYFSQDNPEGFFFDGGRWTYEYYDPEDKAFKPMTAFYKDNQNGWVHGTWSNFYTCFAEAAWVGSDYTYCSMTGMGKKMHPGKTAGVVLTFVVPATGNISYFTSLCMNGNTSPDYAGQEQTWGNHIFLYINDKQVLPAANAPADSNRIGKHNTSRNDPYTVSLSEINVKAGDKIRLLVLPYGGTNDSKNTELIDVPVVTYHSATSATVGNPNGTPPTDIFADKISKKSTDIKVTWTPDSDAVAHNIYLRESVFDGEGKPATKINSAPITGSEYVIKGLPAGKTYDVYVTTLTANGKESAPSAEMNFKTPPNGVVSTTTDDVSNITSIAPDDSDTTDTGTTDTGSTNVVTNSGSTDAGTNNSGNNADSNAGNNGGDNAGNKNTNTDKGGKDNGALIGIIIAVAAVVVVAVVVVIIILGKKKKSAEAALPEEAPAAEAEEAPAAEAAEEAAEEKKDEE